MPNTTSNRLAALQAAIAAIHDQAGRHLHETDALDAIDVLRSLESACQVAISEFYGLGEQDANLLWDEQEDPDAAAHWADWQPDPAEVDELRKSLAVPADTSDVPY